MTGARGESRPVEPGTIDLNVLYNQLQAIWEDLVDLTHLVTIVEQDLEEDLERAVQAKMADDDIKLSFSRRTLERRAWAGGKAYFAAIEVEEKAREVMNKVCSASIEAERIALRSAS